MTKPHKNPLTGDAVEQCRTLLGTYIERALFPEEESLVERRLPRGIVKFQQLPTRDELLDLEVAIGAATDAIRKGPKFFVASNDCELLFALYELRKITGNKAVWTRSGSITDDARHWLEYWVLFCWKLIYQVPAKYDLEYTDGKWLHGVSGPTATVTAGYIDTCLPDYLQDHHNREGEQLVGITPAGQTAEDAAHELAAQVDDVPDGVFDAQLQQAFQEAATGVDFRWIDLDGDRAEDEPEELSESMIWFVVRWEFDDPEAAYQTSEATLQDTLLKRVPLTITDWQISGSGSELHTFVGEDWAYLVDSQSLRHQFGTFLQLILHQLEWANHKAGGAMYSIYGVNWDAQIVRIAPGTNWSEPPRGAAGAAEPLVPEAVAEIHPDRLSRAELGITRIR